MVKTVAVRFTKSRTISDSKIVVDDETIPWLRVIRYLVVIMNGGLTRPKHHISGCQKPRSKPLLCPPPVSMPETSVDMSTMPATHFSSFEVL